MADEAILNQLSARYSSIHQEVYNENFSTTDLNRTQEASSVLQVDLAGSSLLKTKPKSGRKSKNQKKGENEILSKIRQIEVSDCVLSPKTPPVTQKHSMQGAKNSSNVQIQPIQFTTNFSNSNQKDQEIDPKKNPNHKKSGQKLTIGPGLAFSPIKIDFFSTPKKSPKIEESTPKTEKSNPTIIIMSKHERTGFSSNLSVPETENKLQNRSTQFSQIWPIQFDQTKQINVYMSPQTPQKPQTSAQYLTPPQNPKNSENQFLKESGSIQVIPGESAQKRGQKSGYQTPEKQQKSNPTTPKKSQKMSSSCSSSVSDGFKAKNSTRKKSSLEGEGDIDKNHLKINFESKLGLRRGSSCAWLETITEKLASTFKHIPSQPKMLEHEKSSKKVKIEIFCGGGQKADNNENRSELLPNHPFGVQRKRIDARKRSKSAESKFFKVAKIDQKEVCEAGLEGGAQRVYTSARLRDPQHSSQPNGPLGRGSRVQVRNVAYIRNLGQYSQESKKSDDRRLYENQMDEETGEKSLKSSKNDEIPKKSKESLKRFLDQKRSSASKLKSIIANLASISQNWNRKRVKSAKISPRLSPKSMTKNRPKNENSKSERLEIVAFDCLEPEVSLPTGREAENPSKSTQKKVLQKVKFMESESSMRVESSRISSIPGNNSSRISIKQRLTHSPKKKKIEKNGFSRGEKLPKKSENEECHESRLQSGPRNETRVAKKVKKVQINSPRKTVSRRPLKGSKRVRKGVKSPNSPKNAQNMKRGGSKQPKILKKSNKLLKGKSTSNAVLTTIRYSTKSKGAPKEPKLSPRNRKLSQKVKNRKNQKNSKMKQKKIKGQYYLSKAGFAG